MNRRLSKKKPEKMAEEASSKRSNLEMAHGGGSSRSSKNKLLAFAGTDYGFRAMSETVPQTMDEIKSHINRYWASQAEADDPPDGDGDLQLDRPDESEEDGSQMDIDPRESEGEDSIVGSGNDSPMEIDLQMDGGDEPGESEDEDSVVDSEDDSYFYSDGQRSEFDPRHSN
ncbi:MAG: hypothetical protein J3Q66DRAFT_407416 [Benniella sp.]|nr:MAG: hypothetical protein J3Q66DRAFT_407416 [Benniella sp.]